MFEQDERIFSLLRVPFGGDSLQESGLLILLQFVIPIVFEIGWVLSTTHVKALEKSVHCILPFFVRKTNADISVKSL